MSPSIFVLDACSLIAYHQFEEGALIVKNLLAKAANEEANVLIHAATVAEVYYDFLKRNSLENANMFLQELKLNYPIIIVNEVDENLIRQIGYFKSLFKVSFADSFVLALAKVKNAIVITADHHEFDSIEANGELNFEWIK